jgi:hypothetical protein
LAMYFINGSPIVSCLVIFCFVREKAWPTVESHFCPEVDVYSGGVCASAWLGDTANDSCTGPATPRTKFPSVAEAVSPQFSSFFFEFRKMDGAT